MGYTDSALGPRLGVQIMILGVVVSIFLQMQGATPVQVEAGYTLGILFGVTTILTPVGIQMWEEYRSVKTPNTETQ